MKHTKCLVEGCEGNGSIDKRGNMHFSNGYCNMHNMRLWRRGHLDKVERKKKHTKCQIDGCEGSPKKGRNGNVSYQNGYCQKHNDMYKRNGDPLIRKRIGNGEHRKEHPLYNTYKLMIKRCYSETCKAYSRYGGRGITVCDKWRGVDGFKNFVADMGERPEGTTLDRKENDKGYSKENCRWATIHQQNANTRSNVSCVGVNLDKIYGKWNARITINRKYISLGTFNNYDDAVKARKEAEKKYGIEI